jgi:hypothetical protein
MLLCPECGGALIMIVPEPLREYACTNCNKHFKEQTKTLEYQVGISKQIKLTDE